MKISNETKNVMAIISAGFLIFGFILLLVPYTFKLVEWLMTFPPYQVGIVAMVIGSIGLMFLIKNN